MLNLSEISRSADGHVGFVVSGPPVAMVVSHEHDLDGILWLGMLEEAPGPRSALEKLQIPSLAQCTLRNGDPALMNDNIYLITQSEPHHDPRDRNSDGGSTPLNL